jgi:inhibitor of KinA
MRDFSLIYRWYNEQSVLIQWPKEIREDILFDIIAFKTYLQKMSSELICTAAYCELLVQTKTTVISIDDFISQLKNHYAHRTAVKTERHRIRIPVCYDETFGIDQEEVCRTLKLDKHELVTLHTSARYLVYAIGFLPGFMYLGGLPEALYHPRKEIPRVQVPEGAVGIAGMQTGVYPQVSPGGWQIIGSTPVKLFDLNRSPSTLVQVGDIVEFYSVDMNHYELVKIQVATGIYQPEKSQLP